MIININILGLQGLQYFFHRRLDANVRDKKKKNIVKAVAVSVLWFGQSDAAPDTCHARTAFSQSNATSANFLAGPVFIWKAREFTMN